MSQKVIAESVGNVLIENLKSTSDFHKIKNYCIEAWKELRSKIENQSSFEKHGLRTIRELVKTNFPDSEKPITGYYFTESGKNQISRYEHFALWWLSTKTSRWEIDEPFDEVFFNPNTSSFEVKQKVVKEKSVIMTIEMLNLDTEKTALIESYLTEKNIDFIEFVREACLKVVEDAMKSKSDLSYISTKELISNPKYRTVPGRVDELVGRAINGLKDFNDGCTEKSQKWCITQSLLVLITGCKPSLVKVVVEKFKTMIDDHNSKHNLDSYVNRKTNIGNIEIAVKSDIEWTNKFTKDVAIKNDLPVEVVESEIRSIEKDEIVQDVIKPVNEVPVIESESDELRPVETREIYNLSVSSSSLDIYDYLKMNPSHKVRIKEGRKGLHYILLVKNNRPVGFLREESGEIEIIESVT